MKIACLQILLFLLVWPLSAVAQNAPQRAAHQHHEFDRLVLSEEFFSEGAAFGDLNGDGHQDVISGPFWYAGPDFRIRHTYRRPKKFAIKGYSDQFFTFTLDVNKDSRTDILIVGFPDREAFWFENPATASLEWKRHLAFRKVGGESPGLLDITGDGHRELVFCTDGAFGYAIPNATREWTFQPITPNRGYGGFTHGMGVGDVNNDGRPDLLEKNGWWEQPAENELFKFHPYPFAQLGGSQMFAYDFDGDGDNDVLSVQNAHGYGLSWFERRGSKNDVSFIPHQILTDDPDDNRSHLAISQMHAVALADMDGDGVKDIVTGKRYFAHGGGDPGAHQLPVLYWFRTRRAAGEVTFEPHLISDRSGVGTQVVTGDVTGNGRPDVVVGNKLGTFVLSHRVEQSQTAAKPAPALFGLRHTPGTDLFNKNVRTTEPLTAEQEQATFVLPEGFEIQLVAAEPDIGKPMNLAFDERGRLWISSSVEYPFPADPAKQKPRDKISVMEDTNGDGRLDRISTFADGLNIPVGLYPWRDGVVCFSIPNILFLRDTTGDGRADKREVLYGPFDTTRDTHGMCNSFARGFDGWLYACHGFNNQSHVAGRDGHKISMRSGNTFRMRLDGSRLEHFSHGQVNPFGLAFDNNGDLYSADCHTKPLTLLMQGGFYESFGAPHNGLGFVPDMMDHLHNSTAIAGIVLGTATNFPDVYQSSAFHGNVATCRINRNSIEHSGATVRAREEPDFLISGDPWFRPANLTAGPDGSVYVTDFYNRIIGHYEVDLQHPGRDRTRGRVWRIVYIGSENRRDCAPPQNVATIIPAELKTPSEFIAAFAASSPAKSIGILNAFTNAKNFDVQKTAREGLEHQSPNVRIQSLWALHRMGQVTDSVLKVATEDENTTVRIHAFRALAETTATPFFSQYIAAGLQDPQPLVNRAALVAAGQHPRPELIEAILGLSSRMSHSDAHLAHAIRIALRKHVPVGLFRAQMLRGEHLPSIVQIAPSVESAEAADVILRYLNTESASHLPPARIAEYLSHAARWADGEQQLDQLARLARRQFKEDRKIQLDLLKSIYSGLNQRDDGGSGQTTPAPKNATPGKAIRAWATELTRLYLRADEETSAIGWTFLPHPSTGDKQNPWTISTRRNSADGEKNSSLWSSFPLGEQRTGIFRSGNFTANGLFSFYCAGHDGFPQQPLQNNNVVRMRDAASHRILHKSSPPRNDVAQRIEWDTRAISGRQVYLELVDGDTANAFAWLAVGRFSESGLNPTSLASDRAIAAELASMFRLPELRGDLVRVLKSSRSPDIQSAIARTIVDTKPSGILRALSRVFYIVNTENIHANAIGAITNSDLPLAKQTLSAAMARASAQTQLALADDLAADAAGSEFLLSLLRSGKASSRLLQDARIREKLKQQPASIRTAVNELSRGLAAEDPAIAESIATRRAAYFKAAGDPIAGAVIFRKLCMGCHQLRGEGAKYAPNLDGVKGRGLDRLLEDILAPHRNVDVAFRATVIVTTDGQVFTGLLKNSTGARLLLIDRDGKEQSIARAEVDEKRTTRLSPMPTNIAAATSPEEFRNLITFLLQ